MTAVLTVERKKRTPNEPLIRVTSDVYTYWGERISARIDSDHAWPRIERHSAIMHGDTCFHYGSHFPLGKIIRDRRGRTRLVLLNGDVWQGSAAGFGSGTPQRQFEVRNICARECPPLDIPYFIVPFSALDAADIQMDTIVPLEIRPDTTEHRERTSNERPGPLKLIEDPNGATQEVEAVRYGMQVGGVKSAGPPYPEDARHGAYTVYETKPVMVQDTTRASVEVDREPNWWAHTSAELQSDGTWKWTEERHRLGDSLFEATVRTLKTTRDGDGRPLESKWVRRRKVKFLSSFDYNEPHRPYFLCELPRTGAQSVADAYSALKPREVYEAELYASPAQRERDGLEVLRQGDVFAIPTTLTERELGTKAVMLQTPEGKVRVRSRSKHSAGAMILSTNHQATHVIVTKDGYYGKGSLYHTPGGWREPDHRRVKLGDGETWYRLVKNTVPLARTGLQHRGRNLNQSGQSRAWTLGGAVD